MDLKNIMIKHIGEKVLRVRLLHVFDSSTV